MRKLTYLDYTASGRSLGFIEDYIRDQVLPLYANTHTSSSTTGLQTSLFRNEARAIIKTAVHGTDDDVVLFAGSGTTGAVNMLVRLLGIQKGGGDLQSLDSKSLKCSFPGCGRLFKDAPALKLHQRSHTDGDYTSLKTNLDGGSKTSPPVDSASADSTEGLQIVVFVGPYEHHSNILPWRESMADRVVEVKESDNGGLDMVDLKAKLKQYSNVPLKIGAFSAASNITGQTLNVDVVSQVLHEGGAIACWVSFACIVHPSSPHHHILTILYMHLGLCHRCPS